MTTIDNSKNYCTLINVFTVSPEKHLELFELLKEATEKVSRTFGDEIHNGNGLLQKYYLLYCKLVVFLR